MTTFWLTILVFTLLTSIVFGLGGFLIHHWFFKPSNKPDRARIYIDGVSKPYEGFLIHTSKTGSIFSYAKGRKKVFVPASYKVEYHYLKRTIWLDSNGSLVALPSSQDKPLTNNDKDSLIQELVESKIGFDAVRAIKARNSFSMLIIIVAIIVAIFAGVVGYAIKRPDTQPLPNQQPATSEQAPVRPQPKIIIEGK